MLPLWIKVILKQREQVHTLCWNGTVWDAGKLPTHPFPNPTLTPYFSLGTKCWVRGGVAGLFFFPRIVYQNSLSVVFNNTLEASLEENESCIHFKSKPNLVDHKRSQFLKILLAARRSRSCGIEHWRNKV